MFNNIKVIFLDSEGTIRDENHIIKKSTIEEIRNLKKIGIHVIITSGLPRFIVKKISLKANASKYIIASNGADIYNYENKLSIKSFYLNQDFVYQLWKEYKDKFNFILGVGDKEYATCGNEYNKNPIIINDNNIKENFYQCHISQKKIDKNTDNVKKEVIDLKKIIESEDCISNINNELLNKLTDINNLTDYDIKLLIKLKRFLELKKLHEIILNKYENIVSIANQSIDFRKFSYNGETPWFTINSNLVNKGEGIRQMCLYLNIPKSNVMAFGNDYNDRKMINEVENFFCPSNSCQEILNLTKNVYDAKDGIDKVLRKVYVYNE